ncbi:hypothetical protein ACLKA7_008187 [Drosophila subpalustris]
MKCRATQLGVARMQPVLKRTSEETHDARLATVCTQQSGHGVNQLTLEHACNVGQSRGQGQWDDRVDRDDGGQPPTHQHHQIQPGNQLSPPLQRCKLFVKNFKGILLHMQLQLNFC